jgi:hypothetical protein
MIKVKKKTVKVKKKTVKYKKKTAKKKAVKKTTKKKTVKKKAVKKKTTKKRKRKKKILMEDIYVILNKVQISKKKIIFVTELNDAPTIENNIRDIDLRYKKVEMKTQVVFTVYPNGTDYGDDCMLKLEILDDEIPDIDQIFG